MQINDSTIDIATHYPVEVSCKMKRLEKRIKLVRALLMGVVREMESIEKEAYLNRDTIMNGIE